MNASYKQFLCSSEIGYSVYGVVRWWSRRWSVLTRPVLLVAAVSSCTLERTPELSGSHRIPGVPLIPTRSASSSSGLGPSAVQGPMTPVQMSGVTCAGVPCPYTTGTTVSCCTTLNDVDRHAAEAGVMTIPLGQLRDDLDHRLLHARVEGVVIDAQAAAGSIPLQPRPPVSAQRLACFQPHSAVNMNVVLEM